MKSVGNQLQEARLAKNWTPELAARETKIKVDRLRDLEADDYTHFSSPTYARGFVRTYARSLGLDEYKILRQLDNKLPDDDTSNIVTDTGVAYLPETSMPPRAAHRNFAGLYVVMGLGGGIALFIAFILFQAYRVGELPRYFAEARISHTSDLPADPNPTDAAPETDATPKAIPVDPTDTSHAAKAEPVDAAALAANAGTTNDAASVDLPHAAKALPVTAAELAANSITAAPVSPNSVPDASSAANTTNTVSSLTPLDAKTPPRAQPVDLATLNEATTGVQPPAAAATPPAPLSPPVAAMSASARQSNTRAESPPLPATAPILPSTSEPPSAPAPVAATTSAAKRLVLTASQDSFVRVTSLDPANGDKPLYSAVLHGGQSVGFDGHKFSVNVAVPSVVNIKLDDVNYGPHSDGDAPETFVVESHQP